MEDKTSRKAVTLADFVRSFASDKAELLRPDEHEQLLETAGELEYMGLLLSSEIMEGWFQTVAEITADNFGDFEPEECANDVFERWTRFRDEEFREDVRKGTLNDLIHELRKPEAPNPTMQSDKSQRASRPFYEGGW